MRKPMKTPDTAYDGEWDFAGANAPPEGSRSDNFTNFSLGCFQWVRGANGRLKRGKVQRRFYGLHCEPGPEYTKAHEFCRRKNAGVET